MTRYRIFQSALNDVTYVFGNPINFHAWQKLSDKQKEQAQNAVTK